MGGPQSPTELDKYPYLRNEIAFTQQAIEKKIPGIRSLFGSPDYW